MKFGAHIVLTESSITPAELGPLLEDAGFESLFLPEHAHIPVSSQSRHPEGRPIHDRLKRFYDPWIALTAVATVTKRLRLGTGVCLLPQHDPIVLAKQVATLDHLSHGRVLFGVGAGWNREEMRNHGVDPAQRFTVMRERVQAMKRLWMDDEAEFHGELVDFGPLWQWPKSVQKPHPPVLVGGDGPRVLERVADYGDGWIPNARDGLIERIPELQRLAGERGRDPIPVTVLHPQPDLEMIRRYEAAGVARCVVTLPSAEPEQVLPVMEQMARMMGAFQTGAQNQ